MFKNDTKFVKHIFWDPESKTCYPLYVTIENQQKIQNDKAFALKTFQQAKSLYLQNELQKQQKEKELIENVTTPVKRIKKEKQDKSDEIISDLDVSKNEKIIKGEIINDNEIDEKLEDVEIVEALEKRLTDNKNKNKKLAEEEKIISPEFVSVREDDILIDDNDNKTWQHDMSHDAFNNFEDVSEDTEKHNACKKITRKRKVYSQCTIERPKRKVASEKPKIERFTWNHDGIKTLIRSYGAHKSLLDHQIKKKYFWTNIVKDLSRKNVRVDKDTCQTKWHGLLKMYHKCKEKLVFPTNFPYYVMMEEVLGERKIKKTLKSPNVSFEELKNTEKVGSLNVENDSNICNKKMILSTTKNDAKARRVILLGQPINNDQILPVKAQQLTTIPAIQSLSSSTMPAITRNSVVQTKNPPSSQNFTLEDVERVVQNALDTKLQRIVNAFQSTIDSLKSISNSMNTKLTNNEEAVTEIKNKVQNLESELKSASVQRVKLTDHGSTVQSNKKKKIFIISRPKSTIDLQADKDSVVVCSQAPSTSNPSKPSTETVNQTPINSQRQMTLNVQQLMKMTKFQPNCCSTPKMPDPIPPAQ